MPSGLRPGGELDKVIAASAAKDVFSGSVLITYRGRTVLSRSYGMADRARHVPNGPDTMFGLASVSKLFTALSVTQLAQRGKLLYRDTVGKHLDGFSHEVANLVTIHHLLTHTSGLGDFFGDPGYFEEARKWTSVAQATAGTGRIVRQESLASQPGAGHQYSNSGYHVLNEIIERVSGQQMQDYISEHILRASGMGSAGFYSKEQWRDDRRFAHGYYRPPGSANRIDNIDEQSALPAAFASCAQLERFAHALWEEKLLDPAHTHLTLSPKVPTVPPQGSDLVTFEGYGPVVTLGGEHWSYGHNGGSSIGGVIEFVFYPTAATSPCSCPTTTWTAFAESPAWPENSSSPPSRWVSVARRSAAATHAISNKLSVRTSAGSSGDRLVYRGPSGEAHAEGRWQGGMVEP